MKIDNIAKTIKKYNAKLSKKKNILTILLISLFIIFIFSGVFLPLFGYLLKLPITLYEYYSFLLILVGAVFGLFAIILNPSTN
jgi:hypothetical protein